MAEAHAGATPVAHQFDDSEQQHGAASFGMWVFLATEVLFFGGLFCGYTYYRSLYYAGFDAGSHLLKVRYGASYTVMLICSSLTMALGVRAARLRQRKALMVFLVITLLLGAAFVFIKLRFEWYGDYLEHLVPGINFGPEAGSEAFDTILRFHAPFTHVSMFMIFYFIMTGVHALHMTVGVGLLTALLILAWRGHCTRGNPNAVEMVGLYWHFVDIIWIFLFPLLYLIGGRYS